LKAAVVQRREAEVSFCVIIFAVLLRKMVSVLYGMAE